MFIFSFLKQFLFEKKLVIWPLKKNWAPISFKRYQIMPGYVPDFHVNLLDYEITAATDPAPVN